MIRLIPYWSAYLPLTSLLVLGACTPLPELSYETEHLRVGTNFETPLCKGNLDHYEQVIHTIEETLDTTIKDPVEVYLWDEWSGVDPTWCEEDLDGCYRNGKVYSSLGSADHELVHAVLSTLPGTSLFWNEGAAEALQADRTKFHFSAPSENIDADDRGELSYATAGHFSRWVLETYGLDSYRKLLGTQGEGRAVFESVYKISFEDANQQYLDGAPDSYGAVVSCEDLPLPPISESSWTETIDLSCSSPSVYADFRGLYAFRVFSVTQRGDYLISTTGSTAALMRCPDEAYEVEPSFDDPEQYGDVPAYTAEWPTGYLKGLGDTTEPTIADLTPGRYRISTGFEGFDPRTVELSVVAVP